LNNQVWLSSNYYLNASGADTYVGTGAANRLIMDGAYKFFTAPSGTAGNAITFTQAMTLAADGNLGLGTTSPRAISNYVAQTINGTNGSFTEYQQSGSNTFRVGSDSSAGGFIITQGATPIRFGTNDTERARIDSSGRFLLGATSIPVSFGTTAFYVVQPANDYSAVFRSTNATAGNNYGLLVTYANGSPNGTSNEFFRSTDSTALRFSVTSNGGIYNYQANNVNLSDRREKTNFAPAKSYLDTICAIPVQTFNYIDQNMEDDDGLTLGVVAQDVQAVAPELVKETNWGTEDEPKMRLSIYQTDLQYALMKCIQEMKTIIDDQAARIATLEAK
jgi:hypothetical protein